MHKLFMESKPAEGFTKDVQLQNFLYRVFSQSIKDAIDQFFEEARLRPSYPSGATAASWSPIKLEAILKQKFIDAIRQFQASFSNSSSSSTSADSTVAPSADFDTPVEYLRKLALQRSAALQDVVMSSLSNSNVEIKETKQNTRRLSVGASSSSSTVNSTNSPARSSEQGSGPSPGHAGMFQTSNQRSTPSGQTRLDNPVRPERK